MSEPRPPDGPLAGVRIVEFAGIGPGPFAAMLLADMGADIVRIDRPGGADPYSKHVLTRSRPTVTADLKDAAQLARVLDLVDRADALIEGFRPGVMERLGLGPDVLLARNPRLVYGRMTGWGQTGPLAQAAGHDINYIAITGALAAVGPARKPAIPLNLVGDFGGGSLYLAMGILAGVISARQTGRGQVVDCAICDGAASLMAMFSDLSAQGRWVDGREENLLDGGAHYYETYVCADGKHISIGALEPQFYAELVRRTGLTGEGVPDREEPGAEPILRERFATVFRTKTRAEWCAILEGTDACFAPVLTLAEAGSHPHLAARGTFVTVDGVPQPAPAPRFSRTPSAVRTIGEGPAKLEDAIASWR
ncbi:CaiB/BaiF CoA transferase family protein [Microvirga pudoricolor]|uniref:CaiB/BaiF CoA transferase family protein n=1 Tax=Microvirga pudoricolor TaxID=2778729 RepID=UPI00194F4165|nr:CaiB/BaiF CoA-transferase family protein [Microvirga pudoricolor]MBM6596489.1 CoA transferase [Microvirga pudoricolor]